jgi:hypothetical protein
MPLIDDPAARSREEIPLGKAWLIYVDFGGD